jgi:ribosomal 50S subunit-recycling heat shock protein
MRLDLFLKASRLCPRRTIARELCDAGLVSVNGASARASHAVRAGDRISMRRRDRLIAVRVTRVPESKQVSRKDAGGLIEVLQNEPAFEGEV